MAVPRPDGRRWAIAGDPQHGPRLLDRHDAAVVRVGDDERPVGARPPPRWGRRTAIAPASSILPSSEPSAEKTATPTASVTKILLAGNRDVGRRPVSLRPLAGPARLHPLHEPATRVEHDDRSCPARRRRTRGRQVRPRFLPAAGARALSAPGFDGLGRPNSRTKRPGAAEHADSAVARVGDVDVAVGRPRSREWSDERGDRRPCPVPVCDSSGCGSWTGDPARWAAVESPAAAPRSATHSTTMSTTSTKTSSRLFAAWLRSASVAASDGAADRGPVASARPLALRHSPFPTCAVASGGGAVEREHADRSAPPADGPGCVAALKSWHEAQKNRRSAPLAPTGTTSSASTVAVPVFARTVSSSAKRFGEPCGVVAATAYERVTRREAHLGDAGSG